MHKVFVEKIEGPNGEMSVEALKALITTCERFQIAESRADADATLVGCADSGSRLPGLCSPKKEGATDFLLIRSDAPFRVTDG